VGGRLAAIKVHRRDRVRAGDVVAELSALELSAAVVQARAALAAAQANRDHVYTGVRAEEIAALAAEIAKAKSRLGYAEQQLARTTRTSRVKFSAAIEPDSSSCKHRRRGPELWGNNATTRVHHASWRIGRMVHFCAGATTGAWGRSGAISRAEVAQPASGSE
jgi:hypothetical protein